MLDPDLALRLAKLQSRREELLTIGEGREVFTREEAMRIARELAVTCADLQENFEVFFALKNLINDRMRIFDQVLLPQPRA